MNVSNILDNGNTILITRPYLDMHELSETLSTNSMFLSLSLGFFFFFCIWVNVINVINGRQNASFNGSQLAKMKKSIPGMTLA